MQLKRFKGAGHSLLFLLAGELTRVVSQQRASCLDWPKKTAGKHRAGRQAYTCLSLWRVQMDFAEALQALGEAVRHAERRYAHHASGLLRIEARHAPMAEAASRPVAQGRQRYTGAMRAASCMRLLCFCMRIFCMSALMQVVLSWRKRCLRCRCCVAQAHRSSCKASAGGWFLTVGGWPGRLDRLQMDTVCMRQVPLPRGASALQWLQGQPLAEALLPRVYFSPRRSSAPATAGGAAAAAGAGAPLLPALRRRHLRAGCLCPPAPWLCCYAEMPASWACMGHQALL